jgi:hypothetical protein
MSIGGFHAHTSTFLVATMDRYLRDVEGCALAVFSDAGAIYRLAPSS